MRFLFVLLSLPLFAEYIQIEQHFAGMECASCSSALERSIGKMRGVKSVSVKDTRLQVELVPGNTVEIREIQDRIKGVGFTPGMALLKKADGTTERLGETVKRPRITGVAHMALFVKDVEKSRLFYNKLLGYEEPFLLKNPDGKLSLTFVKVNDRQYIELFPEREAGSDRLNHISIETDDAEQMLKYLASKGVKVPDAVGKGRIGNANFNVKDPEGHTLEIVQYLPSGWSLRDQGKAMPDSRLSDRILHVGIVVGSLEPQMKFYRDILGFEEFWRGSSKGTALSWINMKVPDGEDYIEFMLHDPLPAPDKRGSAHHLCLVVPDIEKSLKSVQERIGSAEYSRPLEIRTGINRKRQLNLFDPDGTRIELMEPGTVDGKPAPSSPAPFPE